MFLYQINTQQKGRALVITMSVLQSLKPMSPLLSICVRFQIGGKLMNTHQYEGCSENNPAIMFHIPWLDAFQQPSYTLAKCLI